MDTVEVKDSGLTIGDIRGRLKVKHIKAVMEGQGNLEVTAVHHGKITADIVFGSKTALGEAVINHLLNSGDVERIRAGESARRAGTIILEGHPADEDLKLEDMTDEVVFKFDPRNPVMDALLKVRPELYLIETE